MSAFRKLLDEAGRLDVSELEFVVDPRGYSETDARERWACRASRGSAVVHGRGRTGEEALRRVVAFLGGDAS